MADRDYVIKELKYLHDRETWKEGPLVYDDHAEARRKITADAIALLKAQEPVKPIFDELSVTGACGNCGHELTYQKMIGENVLFEERYDYCPACGRKVLWDADS